MAGQLADKRAGILLVGHGTRSDIGTQQFLDLAVHVSRALSPAPVEPAFLELRQPDIDTAVGRLLAHDIDRLITAPLLLFELPLAPLLLVAALLLLLQTTPLLLKAPAIPLEPLLLFLEPLAFPRELPQLGRSLGLQLPEPREELRV